MPNISPSSRRFLSAVTKKWRRFVVEPILRFYHSPRPDLKAVFWINVVVPAIYIFFIAPFLFFTPRLSGLFLALAFIVVQVLNVLAARTFPGRSKIFYVMFAANFLALPFGRLSAITEIASLPFHLWSYWQLFTQGAWA
ncbi:hypothetical protein FF124_00765 [Martelella lutilitoris]|uniref:Uncharacterized protein n=1 Tax=Martelella lutilitoris TaxID=2583532 RepID=A0A5C4JW01_9HYPH|nr:hypothetical protein [Martelella lutilitoris]TNB49525.1 hypothetical protein FF124_00765 [Martelella lutilitoris]